jgi:hypothetical protein
MKHNNSNDKIVRGALHRVADDVGIDYVRVKEMFIEGNVDITTLFWQAFYERHPYKTKGVDYCYTCRKFHLDFVKPLVPWSIENDLETVH